MIDVIVSAGVVGFSYVDYADVYHACFNPANIPSSHVSALGPVVNPGIFNLRVMVVGLIKLRFVFFFVLYFQWHIMRNIMWILANLKKY